MGSSSRLYDPIRKAWVEATPEEQVRQHLIGQLLALGYPAPLIAVEKALSELPHLRGQKVPNRRLDCLCYADAETPLLLIECKAEALTPAAERQVVGYNRYIGAPYLALVNAVEARFGQKQGEGWHFIPGLVPFSTLNRSLS